MKKIVTCLWNSNDMFHYMFRAEFATLVKLNSPVGYYLHGRREYTTVCTAWRWGRAWGRWRCIGMGNGYDRTRL